VVNCATCDYALACLRTDQINQLAWKRCLRHYVSPLIQPFLLHLPYSSSSLLHSGIGLEPLELSTLFRLFPPRAPSAGMSRPTPPGNHGPVAPTTPHRVGSLDRINETIRSLNDAWNLGLQVRGPHWSPGTGPKSKTDRIYGRIKFYHYQKRTTLDKRLNDFRRTAPDMSIEERLDLLITLLPVPNGTPQSSMQSPRTVLTQSYFPSQLCKYIVLDLRSYSI
jgi:hypothetical protein